MNTLVAQIVKLVAIGALSSRAAAWQNSKNQQSRTPEWTLTGTVLDSSDATPLIDARVTVRGPKGTALAAGTDSSGRYTLSGNLPGTYRLSAVKKGYGSNAVLAPYKTLSLVPGTVVHADLALDRGATIGGRVLNSNKEPIPGAFVVAKIRTFAEGRAVYQTVDSAQTNGRGEYQLTGLPPAAYFVGALQPIAESLEETGQTGAKRLMPRMGLVRQAYYPGVQGITAASSIRLHPAEERSPFDIVLGNTEVHCVSASVPELATGGHGRMNLSIAELIDGFVQGVASADLSRERFEVCNLESGAYQLNLYVFAANERSSPLASMLTVQFEVGREDVDLGALQPQPAVVVQGQAHLSGPKQQDQVPGGIAVKLSPRRRSMAVGEQLGPEGVGSNGVFQLPPTLPGDYDLSVDGLPPGYYVQSVSQAGRDCAALGVNPAAGPISLDVATGGGALGGRTVDSENNPVPDAVVLLVPRHGAKTAIAASDQNGSFRLEGSLPPGDYRLLAFTGLRPGDAQDPDLIRRYLGSATDVAMGPGEAKSLTIQVRRVSAGY